MRIINETNYDTRYLRVLFLQCEKRSFEVYLKHSEPKYRRITVVYGRYRNGGLASINGTWIKMKLSRTLPPNARMVAAIYLHELGHNLGLRHQQMVPLANLEKYVTWIPDGEIVPVKPAKEKPAVDHNAIKLAQAEQKLKEWNRRLKRAQTAIAKYRRKVNYYQKKAAACPKQGRAPCERGV